MSATEPILRFPGFHGEVPIVLLGSLADVKGGKRIPRGRVLEAEPNGFPYITVSDFDQGTVALGKIRYVPSDVVHSIPNYRIKTSDIYISVAGTLGLVGTVPASLDGANLTENANKLTNLKCDQKYLLQYLHSEKLQALIDGVKTTGAQPKLAIYAIKNFEVPNPTLDEQRKIAAFLTAVDDRIQQLSQKKALLEDYKKGVMQQIFTQALRFKDDHGNEFPDWEIKGLGDSIDLLSGFPFASEDILDGQASKDRERVLLMRGVNITEGSIRHSEDQDRFYCGDLSKLQKYELEIGDMVIGMDGSKVGKNSALVGENERGALLVQRVARIRALAGTSLPFIYQHVNSFLFHRYVDQVKTSSGIPHISAKQIREFTIGFPSLPEQTKIANFLSSLDRKIETVAAQLTHTQTFKKGLLQQMFV